MQPDPFHLLARAYRQALDGRWACAQATLQAAAPASPAAVADVYEAIGDHAADRGVQETSFRAAKNCSKQLLAGLPPGPDASAARYRLGRQYTKLSAVLGHSGHHLERALEALERARQDAPGSAATPELLRCRLEALTGWLEQASKSAWTRQSGRYRERCAQAWWDFAALSRLQLLEDPRRCYERLARLPGRHVETMLQNLEPTGN